MKKTLALTCLLMLTVASVVSVMTRPVHADIIIFTAQLLASNEVPPVVVAPSEASASGFVTVTLDTTANTASFNWSMSGLNNSSPVILSHIHEGAAGVNGPIRIDSGITPAAPIPVVQGTATFSRSGIATTAAQIQAIIANPAGFYFNVHTALSPGGVGRGQLVRAAAGAPGTSAPTLSQWGAILMTLLFIAVCTWFLAGRRRTVSATVGAEGPQMVARTSAPIDWKLLARVAVYVEAVVALVLIAWRPGPVDMLGALTSGLIIAFIAHSLIISTRRT